ncbi:MAG: SPFH domain-containing protein [Lachnospiraceae bacterium]|nr:SPFH domain-containing protein [Lachnospiraceae bacterium]
MGLLQVGIGAAASVLSDQWREYFYCGSLDANTLVVKGSKRRGKGSNNVISNGSIVAVNEGQCMIIVEQGAIVDVCAEPGEFVFDSSKEPSIFYGGLVQGIKDSFETWKKRVGFGGDTGVDQRVYYFNTKEIIGNKYGTANPVPFRVVDKNINLDVDISIACHGEYSYKIQDPILFYKNVCGNVESAYTRDKIDSQLKSEVLTALQPAFAEISEMGIRYSSIPAHADDVAKALNDVLSSEWSGKRGIVISAFGVNSLKASEEDEKMIKELQKLAAYKTADMGAAAMTAATAQAMQDAAKNEGGAMLGFAGVNMAQQMSGINAGQLYAMSQGQQPQMQPASQVNGWNCPSCGQQGNTGKFCQNCGSPKPESTAWVCPSCGQQGNTGKFCQNCGAPRA